MKQTKIVATIGPVSGSKDILEKMIKLGMNVARLNFSHGTHKSHQEIIKNIRQVSKKLDEPIAIIQDLQGPRIRVGDLKENLEVKKNEKVFLFPENASLPIQQTDTKDKSTEKKIPVSYGDFARNLKKNNFILIADGMIQLKVLEKKENGVECEVLNKGIISSQAGINFPGVSTQMSVITDKDKKDLQFGILQGVDFVALSFVGEAKDILETKNLIHKYYSEFSQKNIGTSSKQNQQLTFPLIIAKIETQEAIKNFDEILKTADGIMIARGDLGVEISQEKVPLIQKEIIGKCLQKAKPVIVATQMLNSMIRFPRPTRAEVSDVANAVVDHTDAVMLSGETAFGQYPLKSVEIMTKIIKETEISPYDDLIDKNFLEDQISIPNALSKSAYYLAKNIKAKAILAATLSGFTARMISRHRFEEKLIVMTNHPEVYRQMSLIWGVRSYIMPECGTLDELINRAVNFVQDKKIVKSGDKIVIVTGQPVSVQENMNLIKVQEIK
jgi:pyruvate kinase